EGAILKKLEEAGAIPPRIVVAPPVPGAIELVPLSGIPAEVPEGISLVTGLARVKIPTIEPKKAGIGMPPIQLEGMVVPPTPDFKPLSKLGKLVDHMVTKKYWFMRKTDRTTQPF
ncbi:unnamed protein product, partial [marine sediment metagenome]